MMHSFSSVFSSIPLAFGMPSGFEWLIIAGIGLLIFGKRLPEVGKSLGQGIVQFKKGLKGVEDDDSSGPRSGRGGGPKFYKFLSVFASSPI